MGSEPRDRLRVGREVAGIAGDAVMASLAEVLERLHRDPPAPEPDDPEAEAPEAEGPDGRRGGRLVRALPTDQAADLVAAVVAEIVPQVLARMDLDAVVDRVDVQRIVDRIDVQRVVDRIDPDALASRIDVDALVERLDVDRVVRRIDLTAATREALEAVRIDEIVRESSATIGSDLVEGFRAQAMRADDLVARLVDRLLRRREPRQAPSSAGGTRP